MGWLGGIGWPELLIILAVVLLVVGGRRLPEAGRALGQAIWGFKQAVQGGSLDEQKAPWPANTAASSEKENSVSVQDSHG